MAETKQNNTRTQNIVETIKSQESFCNKDYLKRSQSTDPRYVIVGCILRALLPPLPCCEQQSGMTHRADSSLGQPPPL